MRWIKEYRSYSQNSEKNDVANRIGSSRPNWLTEKNRLSVNATTTIKHLSIFCRNEPDRINVDVLSVRSREGTIASRVCVFILYFIRTNRAITSLSLSVSSRLTHLLRPTNHARKMPFTKLVYHLFAMTTESSPLWDRFGARNRSNNTITLNKE
jgi:hypothetical protein